jgi:hypothetical protein
MTADAILDELITLKANEIKEIKARCVYLLNKNTKGKKDFNPTPFIDTLYLHLRLQGRKLGLSNFQPVEKLAQVKAKAVEDFIVKARTVEHWTDLHFTRHVGDDKLLQERLIQLLITLYIAHMRSIFDTINPWNLLACIDYIPQVFEDAFPEYIANNLQGLVIKHLSAQL